MNTNPSSLPSTSSLPAPSSNGASWLFNQLSARPAMSNEHLTGLKPSSAGLKPPAIDEDDGESQVDPSNASVLSFSSSVEVESEGGGRRRRPRPQQAPQPTRMSDDGYVRVHRPSGASSNGNLPLTGQQHFDTMPRPRTSEAIDRLKDPPQSQLPLTSLYLVSGLPKNPSTWTLADADSIAGVHHSESAVGRWWRAEVLGSTITPGVNGGKDKSKKKRGGKAASVRGAGESAESKAGLGRGDLGKMLSKSLKLSFTREVEIIASTLQPASTVHSFTFSIPSTKELTAPASAANLRSSVYSNTTANRDSAYQPNMNHGMHLGVPGGSNLGVNHLRNQPNAPDPSSKPKETTYHGVCLTVWSHADEDRTAAIRRTLETAAYARNRAHKLSMSSMATSIGPASTRDGRTISGPTRPRKASVPWSGTEMDESETDMGAMTESEADFGMGRSNVDGAGASTLFLPQNTVFWLPYALTLVSRHPIYDLMRDYLTLSWARFSKDVQSHTLQIAKILEAPSPRAGDIVRLDAGASGEQLEVVCRFPGGLDFGRGLVDVNFTMWPLFRCLNLDNILTLCEIALAPTGRILLVSRHPAMLGIAVSTVKYLVELRGWNGVAHHTLHARDAKIYLEDPGPWIIGLSTEARYCIRPSPEVCVCDLDINYVNCPSPPSGAISMKQQRDKFRKMLMGAFDQYFHPDHGVPSEFKEAFPAGRFRPLCKITSKRGSSVVAESIKAPEWWHQSRVISAFDAVLKEKAKKPSLIKRISTLGMINRKVSGLSPAEVAIQASIRKRATAFVDARDDLETKIGRLSRRLNFLMTESELWRQKFVAFEGYAEKLSSEAGELRAKINKEQRESKRLSGLVTITAHEKHLLQSRLQDTESKHKNAVVELEQMRIEMEEMEAEREQMVAEVEAQIKRALASMTLSDHYESDHSQASNFTNRTGHRFASGRSNASRPGTSSGTGTRAMRSFGTASTLANPLSASEESNADENPPDDTLVVPREEDIALSHKESVEPTETPAQVRKRRFSNTTSEPHLDGLDAVDLGISQRIDTVSEKMLAIQQKLENAFEHTRKTRSRAPTPRSELNSGDEAIYRPPSRTRPARTLRNGDSVSIPRARAYSNQSQSERDSWASSQPRMRPEPAGAPPVPPLPVRTGSTGTSSPSLTRRMDSPNLMRRTESNSSVTQSRPHSPRSKAPSPSPVTMPFAPPGPAPSGVLPPAPNRRQSVRGTGTAPVIDDSDDSYMSAYSDSPPQPEKALPEDVDRRLHDTHHGTSIAEVLLQDHDYGRSVGKDRSPLLVAHERSPSSTTTATALADADAMRAVPVTVEIGSPTISDYSARSSAAVSETTRVTSGVPSTEC